MLRYHQIVYVLYASNVSVVVPEEIYLTFLLACQVNGQNVSLGFNGVNNSVTCLDTSYPHQTENIDFNPCVHRLCFRKPRQHSPSATAAVQEAETDGLDGGGPKLHNFNERHI